MQTELITPDGYDKDGPYFEENRIARITSYQIHNTNFFYKRAKRMTADLEASRQHIDQAAEQVARAMDGLQAKEAQFAQTTKKVSGSVRDAAQKLADGLARVEKAANFDRLARYAELLERIERSLSTLADLEKQGLLDKVAKALK